NVVLDMTNGQKLFEFPQRDFDRTFFSPDDRYLILVGGRYDAILKKEGVAGQIWDATSAKLLSKFELAGMGGHYTAGVSPDGRTLAVSSLGYDVNILDLPSGCLRVIADRSCGAPESKVELSPDGRLFAFGQ